MSPFYSLTLAKHIPALQCAATRIALSLLPPPLFTRTSAQLHCTAIAPFLLLATNHCSGIGHKTTDRVHGGRQRRISTPYFHPQPQPMRRSGYFALKAPEYDSWWGRRVTDRPNPDQVGYNKEAQRQRKILPCYGGPIIRRNVVSSLCGWICSWLFWKALTVTLLQTHNR